MNCTCMVYRISISENTMERLKKYAAHQNVGWRKAADLGKRGSYRYTVDNVIQGMLAKEGF
jgi:hypothetical protein